MQSERWDRIQTLFHAAAELSGDTRKTFLEHACNGDGHLLQQVLSLLAEDERGESLFEQGLAPWVNQFIGNSDGLPPHRQVGNYRLIKPLGEGGMGVVYLAERVDLGQVAAVKLLRDAWLSPARQQRFLSEQKTLAQLVHPSIARLYDANTLPDGTPWFAMEYVDGVPLTTYCQQEQCEIHDRLKLFRAVCEAVQYGALGLGLGRETLKRPASATRTDRPRFAEMGEE